MPAQTLLIDADDTLWENNVYFERAIVRFISFLNHHEFSPEQVREVLNDVERECIVTHGYGLHSFSHALVNTFERLSVQPVTPELHTQITVSPTRSLTIRSNFCLKFRKLCVLVHSASPHPGDQGRGAPSNRERSSVQD